MPIFNKIVQKIVAEKYDGNRADMAKDTGLSRQYLGEICNNKTILGETGLKRILESLNLGNSDADILSMFE